jgi:UDP-glucose 4-epimerase
LRDRREIPIVYASTAAVYGNCNALPIGEQSPTAPLSAYGADKHACELHARIAGLVHRIPTLGLRFFNLYGPRQDPTSPYSGVIAIFANRLSRGLAIEIFGDGQQIRDFTYVDDAVGALARALQVASPKAPVFNVCTGRGTTVQSLAETISGLYGTELVKYHRPARSGEVKFSIGDPRQATALLGFKAKTSLSVGLAKMLNLAEPQIDLTTRLIA